MVIVESPGKIHKIEKILTELFPESKFIVTASVGHILDLDKKTMSINIENNFEPKYVPMDKSKAEIIQKLRKIIFCW